MSFTVAADAYDRFMGRFSEPLAPQLAELAGVAPGQRVLDVGCGTGALTAELVRRTGEAAVSAVDPSEPFVAAVRARHPGVDVRRAGAEQLPYADGSFDAALACLVVHFLDDPVAGLRETARVVRPGGVVAACVWDFAEGGSPLSAFWQAARELDPSVEGERTRPGARRGELAELLREAGLADVQDGALSVSVGMTSFAQSWRPFTLGVGPAGAHVAGLDEGQRRALEERCRALLPQPPFPATGLAWAARGTVRERRSPQRPPLP